MTGEKKKIQTKHQQHFLRMNPVGESLFKPLMRNN